MPAKQKDTQSQFLNRLNKTLGNFEARIERLEKQVSVLTKLPPKYEVPSAASTETVYQNPPKRNLGWTLVWGSIFLFIAPWFGFRLLEYIIPYGFSKLLFFALLITGIVLVSTNPKTSTETKVKTKKPIDLGQDSLFAPEKETKKSAAVQPSKKISKEPKGSFEEDFGKKWLPKIGIIAIVLGVAFFVIYAIQNKWIGPTGQVALGVLAGIALIIVGEVFSRKDYYNYAMTLVGGGFAIIYFSIFAAYRFYKTQIGISLYVDIIALTIIIMAAVYFSIRYNSILIAAEAFFLGYLVPMLTSSVNTFFLVYAIALTAGLTFLAYYKDWKLLGAGGMIAMYVTHIFWLNNYNGSNESALHIMFLFIYFVMFAIMALNVKEVGKGKEEYDLDSWLTPRNVFAVIFAVSYLFIFAIDFEKNPLLTAVPLIILLLLLAFFVMKFRWDYFTVGGIVMTFFVHWTWLQHNLHESSLIMNFAGLSIYFVLFNILLLMLYEGKNKISNVIGIVANSAFFYALNLWPIIKFNKGYDGLFTAALAIFYLILAYIAYNKEISHYLNTYLVLCFGYLTLAVPLQFNREWISISWAVLTLVLVLLSFRLKEEVIRIASSVVGVITLIRVLFYDSWKLNALNLANFADSTRLFAFAATIIVFYIIAYLYYKNRELFDDYKTYIIYLNAAYAIAATLLTTIIVFIEIWDTSLALNAKKLWTSIAFIAQAIVILGFGFSAKIKLFRILGLILFGLAIVKVFLYDLSSLEMGYRIISFIVLGIIALLGAFLYNKYKEYL